MIQKEEKNYFLLPLDHFLYKIKNIYEANKDEYCLPRSYDREVIRNYWIRRPLSVVSRFGKIGYELSPTVASYIYHKQQQQQNNGGVNNNDSASSASLSASSLEEKIKEEEELKTQQRQQQQAIQLREALTNLGPAFVKAGQQIAIRPDLIPPSMLKELQKLCDSVRPIPDEVAMEVLRNELRMKNQQQIDDIFEDLHLVASASLGQVYKARIRKTNELVAIKVQRPGMEKAFSLDLFLLQMWGDFMDAFTSVFTKQVPFHSKFFDAFSQGSYFELDYENEAQNQIYFQRELANRHSKVKVPDVYEEYSTRRVLTSEWIEGVKLADSSNETIRELIPIGVELFLTQLLDMGRFHCDPHPGNLLVTDDGVLCLIDYGLCAEVEVSEREALTKAIVHLLYRDFDSLIHNDTKELGFLPRDFDTEELKPILTKVLTGGLLQSGSDLKKRKRKLMEISNELNEIFFRYPFQVPGN